MRHRRLICVIALMGLLGAASAGPAMAADDPLEGLNRRVHSFNRTVQVNLLRPLAELYEANTSPGFRRGVSNTVANLGEPVSAVSGLMAGDLDLAWNAAARFGINSTLGLAGVYDPAASMGYARRPAAVADALCAWGVPSGPFLVLPLIGPSTIRDAGALIASTTALSQAIGPEAVLAWSASDSLITYAEAQSELGRIEAQSLDVYAVYRSAYLQRRAARCRTDRDPGDAEGDTGTP
ncbi:VacJ family lipoprotein [Roseomonas hellenica]|uniref:VacJ family lipoprotein n=1 Tax=Plastoroseomonas hellenica TaxID=2687306 RepID=A0ABS5F265_9PROT|nr:VacJ family lipoprotein [Plastoroseomonas hellenica]MBR0666666.1 VacJ family lipoprotein [Plastoroseomonas hellenica]